MLVCTSWAVNDLVVANSNPIFMLFNEKAKFKLIVIQFIKAQDLAWLTKIIQFLTYYFKSN